MGMKVRVREYDSPSSTEGAFVRLRGSVSIL